MLSRKYDLQIMNKNRQCNKSPEIVQIATSLYNLVLIIQCYEAVNCMTSCRDVIGKKSSLHYENPSG